MPPPGAAPTAFDLPAVTEAPAGDGGPADLDATRFDLPAVSADPAATSYDLPAVPRFPPRRPIFPPRRPSSRRAALPMIPPDWHRRGGPAAGATETRFDLAAVPEDLMAAGYDLRPAAPAEADSATKILPALGTDQAGPRAPAGPPVPAPAARAASSALARQPPPGRHRRRQAGRAGSAAASSPRWPPSSSWSRPAAWASTWRRGARPPRTRPPPPCRVRPLPPRPRRARPRRPARRPRRKASAAAQASASAAAKASQAAAAKAEAQRVVSLPVASATAFGPDGFADGDNPGNAKYAIARDASQPWRPSGTPRRTSGC